MGVCSSAPQHLINQADGDEEAYHKKYMEDKILGEGEFGVVKLVHDISSGKMEKEPFASKELKKGVHFKDNTLYSPLKPEIIRGECEILKTLAGKHYCLALVGIYETPKVVYMITELCSGGEMMEYVAQQEELRTECVSRISFQLLDAVNHCAKHGVLHRDIKPENTMFRNPNPGAELRLIDFGSGTMDVVSASTDIHTTMAGSGFYISPEVFQRSYTNKTDVWSSGVTLYVLVAGYPADELQKAFNVLHKSKRNLRDLPQMPEQMPDSFIDLLDALLAYNPKTRKSAGDMLNCEFLNFYKTLQTNGLSLEDIAAEAAEAVTPLPEDSITRRIRRTKSVNLSGSVQRHSMFLDYQRFERSVTTLLATLLTKAEFDSLLAKLTARNEPAAVEEQVEVEADSTKIVVTNSQKLKVIPINELKDILTEMKQDRVRTLMEKLPNASSYSTFAFHVELLKQFAATGGTGGAVNNPRVNRRSSVNSPSSVHGNNIYEKKMTKAASLSANHKDHSWHAGQKGGGSLTRGTSFAK